MLSKLREVLLTQYIGSILIALFIWQAAIELILTAVRTGFWAYDYSRHRSVFGGYDGSPYPWDNLILAAVTVILYLLAAFVLARWLFPPASTGTNPESNESSEVQPETHE